VNLSPLPIQKFFDNNGRPLVGGLLYTYEAGTSTKIVTYKDESGSSQNTNPIVLDYRGECQVWLDPELTYKFVLSPPNDTDPPTNPIWTVDNIASGITLSNLTQQIIASLLYPRSSAEINAGITPASPPIYVYGDPRRSATYRSAGWVNYGDVPTYISGNQISVAGDQSARYSRGRRVQTIGASGVNESRILNGTFSGGITLLDLINDVSGNGGLLGSVPPDAVILSLGVGGDLNTTNTWVQDSNAIVGQNFINRNLGTAAASRLVIGNYASDPSGGATADTSALAIVVTGGSYASSYLPGMAPGRNIILHSGLPVPITLGTWDTQRIFIPAENGTNLLPIVFFNPIKTVLNKEAIRLCAPTDPGNTTLAWYRSNETTRKGQIGYDSGADNNLSLINFESGRIILETSGGGDITLNSSTEIQLAAGTYIKISNGLGNYANDAAAAAGGVPVTGLYRNGSVVMIRVT
jgi:hypothetical protein